MDGGNSRSTREIPRVLFSNAATYKKRVRTIKAWKGSGAHICVKAQERRNELEDKECDADGG